MTGGRAAVCLTDITTSIWSHMLNHRRVSLPPRPLRMRFDISGRCGPIPSAPPRPSVARAANGGPLHNNIIIYLRRRTYLFNIQVRRVIVVVLLLLLLYTTNKKPHASPPTLYTRAPSTMAHGHGKRTLSSRPVLTTLPPRNVDVYRRGTVVTIVHYRYYR